MKQYKVGNSLWLSKFNPKGFRESLELDENGVVKPVTKKEQIFLEPQQYVVVNVYPITRNHTKWVVELAEAKESFEHCGDCGVFPAALLGAAKFCDKREEFKPVLSFEMDSAQISGKNCKIGGDCYISKRKSKLSRILFAEMQKLRKTLKLQHKYNYMSLITSCMFGIKTVSQLQRMAEKNPQDFL